MKFPNLEIPRLQLKDKKIHDLCTKKKELLPCICSQSEL